jgi:uncharacterized membrane protein
MEVLMIRMICVAALITLGASFTGAEDANARPVCYAAKNCVNQIGFNDCHNCKQRSGKSWRSKEGGACVSIRNCP